MNCEQTLSLIDDLAENELDGQNAARVNAHFFACQNCRGQYEILRREKEIYARYLSDAEPPNDLWANFQTRLAAEKRETLRPANTTANAAAEKTRLFGLARLFPQLAGAALLVLIGIGFGWIKFATDDTGDERNMAATEPRDSKLPAQAVENQAIETPRFSSETENAEINAAPKNGKRGKQSLFLTARAVSADNRKSIAETVKIRRLKVAAKAEENPAIEIRPSENERLRKLQLKNLETAIAGQIERVELLLRSFRNARAGEAIGTAETFDVEYEKRQARRLLGANARLRRDAENYGISDVEELLSRVEPYLLDIANLEDNPAPDKVLDIKARVKDQSIIASLQIY